MNSLLARLVDAIVKQSALSAQLTSLQEDLTTLKSDHRVSGVLTGLAAEVKTILAFGLALDTVKTRIDYLIEKVTQIESRLEGTQNIRLDLAALQSRLSDLQKTAAGRGNVLLPGGRMLTRISMPQYFPHFDPILFVNADDKLIVPKIAMNGYYELESTHFVGRNVKPQDHVVDVGANFGYYTVMMGILAGWKGKVVAFEPLPKMATLLRENALINWIDPWVKVIRAACSEGSGSLTLFTSQARAANTSVAPTKIADGFGPDFVFTPFEAPTVAIDDCLGFLEGRVDFMKIDTEGSEPLALRGARRTIASNPGIKIMMEWSPDQLQAAGFNTTEFATELEATGLNCYLLGGAGDLTPLHFETLGESSYQNIVLMRRP